MTATGMTNSQDQCISSESVQDESCGNHVQSQMKPSFFLSNPEFSINFSQAHFPYAHPDPFYNGLFSAYGPQAVIQPQMVGMAPARVALPLDLADDGPIYVNAKQYHGILRRRQMRAKLEAQNKLVKNRKPYLHESRHLHALNRVRGSGGRFMSTKKSQQADSSFPTTSQDISASWHFNQNGDASEPQMEANKHDAPTSTGGITPGSGGDIFQHQDHRFSSFTSRRAVSMQHGGGLMGSGNQHCAPTVR